MENKISDLDRKIYQIIRENISDFIKSQSDILDSDSKKLLDIAPQDHKGSKEFFNKSEIFTADIDKESGADYIIDICENNSNLIPDESFDIVLCTEVLEHTLNPFSAVSEINRILKKNGILLMSTPFNFRIHGPLPDCWRFTEHGIKALLKDFKTVEIKAIEDTDRFLMPFHYTTVAIK